VQPSTPIVNKNHLPSPVTHQDSLDSKRDEKEVTATPPNGRPTAISHRRTPDRSPEKNVIVSSPPAETQTQVASQYDHKPYGYLQYVEDEIKEGVWGYLIPLDGEYKQPLILKTRNPCPKPCGLNSKTDKALSSKKKKPLKEAEESFEREKEDDAPGGGYFVGRHPECGKLERSLLYSNTNHQPRFDYR
jgi:serine/threonine-protein kinase Chk2